MYTDALWDTFTGSHRLAVLSYLDGRLMSPEVGDQSKRKAAIMFSNTCDQPKLELTQMSVSSEMYSSHSKNERTRQPHCDVD